MYFIVYVEPGRSSALVDSCPHIILKFRIANFSYSIICSICTKNNINISRSRWSSLLCFTPITVPSCHHPMNSHCRSAMALQLPLGIHHCLAGSIFKVLLPSYRVDQQGSVVVAAEATVVGRSLARWGVH